MIIIRPRGFSPVDLVPTVFVSSIGDPRLSLDYVITTAVPELLNVSNIYGVQIANVGSPSIVRLTSYLTRPSSSLSRYCIVLLSSRIMHHDCHPICLMAMKNFLYE
jgi:hypothetical protein